MKKHVHKWKYALLTFCILFSMTTVKAQDVGVTTLITPVDKTCGSKNAVVIVVIKNYSTSTLSVSNVPVTLEVTGAGSLKTSEVLKKTISSLKSDTLTFTSTLNNLKAGTYNFKIYTTLSGDKVHTNDTLKVSLTMKKGANDPTVKDAIVCSPSIITLKNTTPDSGATTIWEDGKNVISSSDSFSATFKTSTVLYVKNSFFKSGNASTTFAAGNGQNGNMFDVKVNNVLQIDSFTISPQSSGTDSAEFWYRTGTFSGHQSSSSGWTRIGGVKFNNSSSGTGTKVNVVFSGLPLTLQKGTYGFYVRLTGSNSLNYTDGSGSIGSDSFYNKDLTIYSGDGICGLFGNTCTNCPCSPRIWNGTIHYSNPGCTSDQIKVNIIVGNIGFNLIKGDYFNGAYNAGNIKQPDNICANDSVSYKLVYPSNFDNTNFDKYWEVVSMDVQTPKGTKLSNATLIKPTSKNPAKIVLRTSMKDFDSTYILTVKIRNKACSKDTVLTRYLQVYKKPTADFSFNDVCEGKSMHFTNKTTPDTTTISGKNIRFEWYINSNKFSTKYDPTLYTFDSGKYVISLVAYNGSCRDSVAKTVYFYPNSLGASFKKGRIFHGLFVNGTLQYPDLACAQDTVIYNLNPPKNFKNEDYGKKWKVKSISVRTYKLQTVIKDTSTETANSSRDFSIMIRPTSFYADSFLTLQVTLTTLQGGCDTTFERIIYIGKLPTANFGFTEVCEGQETTFFDSTNRKGIKYLSFVWDFGDGGSAKQAYANHTFAKAGIYNVKLTVVTSEGCSDFITKKVKVYAKPKMRIATSALCVGETIDFYDSSTTDGNVLKHYWEIGSFKSNLASPSYKFNKAGKYKVKLAITVSTGCVDTIVQEIEILPKPVADFEFKPSCLNDSSRFINTSTADSLATYEWDFGDGTTSKLKSPAKIFFVNGTYEVKLKVKSPSGCESEITKKFSPFVNPKAAMSVVPACAGNATQFKDISQYTGSSLGNLRWNFGDGQTSTQNPVNHVYTKAGTYTVSLMVQNANGCKDSITNTVKINAVPIADFTASDVCLGQKTVFNNTSTGSGSAMKYEWDFGDDKTDTLTKNPEHTYAKVGSYNVKLKVSENGCSSSKMLTVNVIPGPTPKWTYDNVGKKVTFTPTDKTYTSYLWIFGDGDSSTDVSPLHFYPSAIGTYTVKLIVKDAQGCSGENSEELKLGSAIFNYTANNWEVKIYPNPTTGKTVVSYELNKRSMVKIALSDIQGREVLNLKNAGYEQEGKHQLLIDGTSLPAGMYILKMVVGDQIYNANIMIQK